MCVHALQSVHSIDCWFILHCFVHAVHGYLFVLVIGFGSRFSISSSMCWSLLAVCLLACVVVLVANISSYVTLVVLLACNVVHSLNRCSWVSVALVQNLQVLSLCAPLKLFFAGNMRVLALKSALAWFLVSVLRYWGLWFTFQFPIVPVSRNCTLLFSAPLWFMFVLWCLFIFSFMWVLELFVLPISVLRASVCSFHFYPFFIGAFMAIFVVSLPFLLTLFSMFILFFILLLSRSRIPSSM